MGECELDSCKVPRASHPIHDSKMHISGNGENIFPYLFPDGAIFFQSKTQLVTNNVSRGRQNIVSILSLVNVIRCVFGNVCFDWH